jgi:hypothetical protein
MVVFLTDPNAGRGGEDTSRKRTENDGKVTLNHRSVKGFRENADYSTYPVSKQAYN